MRLRSSCPRSLQSEAIQELQSHQGSDVEIGMESGGIGFVGLVVRVRAVTLCLLTTGPGVVVVLVVMVVGLADIPPPGRLDSLVPSRNVS